MRLEGRCALVTGSDSGIGRGIAEAFAREGADVVVHYHRGEDAAHEVVGEIRKLGRRSFAVQADVGSAAEAARLVSEAAGGLGRLDVLVNNAGLEIREPLVDVTEEHYDLVMDVNLKGPFFTTQAAVRRMIDQGDGGRIVNVSSIHEDVPFLEYTTYTMSKGGLRMLTRTACQELAAHGITINDVAPGAIETPINRHTLDSGDLRRQLEEIIPAGRLGTPDDVAAVVVFLASEGAAYVTGSTYYVDGGMTNWNKGL